MNDTQQPQHDSKMKLSAKRAMAATLAVMPLSISVIPWGILCGALCIEAGLSGWQAQMMSLLIFAGAAQIAGVAIMGAAGSWLALLNSTTMIGIRHVLYSATYKEHITPLPFYKRVIFAFLLTDEMFLVAQADQAKTGRFDYGYAIVAGFVFYVIWNLATLAGIVSASLMSNIDELGFDFAIAATFIAMVVPMLKRRVLIVAVVVSGVLALLFEHFGIGNGLILAALIGMMVGARFSPP